MKPRVKLVVFLIILIFGLIFIFPFVQKNVRFVAGIPMLKKHAKETAKPVAEKPPVPVKVYKVAKVSFRDTLPSLGTIKGFREIDLKFPVSGTIEYINFKEGERITQGDIIASLDQKEALLKLEYTKVEFEKQTKLYELGSTAEAKLKQSQIEYQTAKVELDKTNLVALSDGTIGSIEVDKGSVVTPQDKVGTFVDMKDVYIEFGIIEKDIAKIKEGQHVEVTLDSYPDQIFKGQVDSISPIIEGRSRTAKVRSKISNPDERVKPGMFGRVNVLVYEKDDTLVIPSSSFKKKEDKYFVYLVHPNETQAASEPAANGAPGVIKNPIAPQTALGTVEIRPIEITYATPDAIEIKEGLEEGDLVAVDLEQELQDKDTVEITETQEGIF